MMGKILKSRSDRLAKTQILSFSGYFPQRSFLRLGTQIMFGRP